MLNMSIIMMKEFHALFHPWGLEQHDIRLYKITRYMQV